MARLRREFKEADQLSQRGSVDCFKKLWTTCTAERNKRGREEYAKGNMNKEHKTEEREK